MAAAVAAAVVIGEVNVAGIENACAHVDKVHRSKASLVRTHFVP